MQLLNNNVTALQQGTVYEDIRTFLDNMKSKSENTAINYERSIKQFFMFMRNKKIEQLIDEDLVFKNKDMIKYRLYLQEQHHNNGNGYSNSTINSYIYAIVSLYNYLERNDHKVRAKVMELDSLPETGESYGKLSLLEAEKMAELVRTQSKGVEKSLLIQLAYKTSIRESALLSLTWHDIKKDDDKNIYIITVYDKGVKKDRKPISEQMYNDLLKIKNQEYYKRYSDDRLFHVTIKTISVMMKTLREQMGIPNERNIVFHSLKNVAINWELQVNNDITRAKRQGNHSDVNTTLRHYADNNTDMEAMAGIQMERQIDDTVFDQLTLEEFKQLCKGVENGLGLQLRIRAQKLLDVRS